MPATSAGGGRRSRIPSAAWWLLAGTLVVAGYGLLMGRLAGLVASAAEAGIAASAAGARLVRFVGDPLPFADVVGARQLAVLGTVVPPGDLAAIDAARLACLVVGAATALLVWPVQRALGVPPPAAAVGVVLAGAAPAALGLATGVAPGVLAAFWLAVAAALATRLRRPGPALLAVVPAVLTAPLAAAALLALLAHLVLDRTVRVPARARAPVGAGSAVLAVAVAVTATSPEVGTGGPLLDTGPALVVAGAGAVLLLVVGRALPWARPVLTPPALLLVVVALPGPARVTAALLVLPVLAVLAGLVLGALGEPSRSARPAPTAVVAIALVLGIAATSVLSGPAPVRGAPAEAALAAWAVTELPTGTVVRADALDRVALLAAGFPAGSLRGPGDPPQPGEVVLLTRRPGDGAPVPASCPASAPIASVPAGSGGSPAVLCRDGGGAEASGGPLRARLGAALADNPALGLAPGAAALLRAGAVDERAVVVLAAMAPARDLVVTDFPAAALDPPGTPRRQVLVTSVDGTPASSAPLLRTWLEGQQPPYVPARLTPDGDALLLTWFTAAVPLPD